MMAAPPSAMVHYIYSEARNHYIERDRWKFKARDETKNRSFVMSHDKIEPMIWDRF